MNSKLAGYETVKERKKYKNKGYDSLEGWKKISEDKFQDSLVAYLQEQIAKFIGITASELDGQQSLQYLGIDSLIAVKLRNRLRKDLRVKIPAVKFMEDITIVSLATLVGQQIDRAAKSPDELNTPKLEERKQEVLVSQYYPLTYGQQGIWFMYKLAPKSAAYNIAFTARIRSELNVSALQKALETLILRHPSLRTTFGQGDEQPFQEVHQHQDISLEKIDASTWSWDELTEKAIAAYRRPFDLEQGPLLRVNLFTRSAQDYVFLLTIHHIVVDGFSFGILLSELRELYQAENRGKAISLAPIKNQYRDFVEWQQEMLTSPTGEKLWQYWQQQLAGELPVLELPTDKPRPSIPSYRGTSYTFELSQELVAKVREVAKVEGATLYMTLLTVFQILLHRYTSQEDIIVGSPTEGRSQSEFTDTVGFFVNMLALRVNLAGNPTFSELLSQVRQTVLGALAHQDYPSPLLIEKLQVNRDASLTGLFRVSFNLLQLQEMGAEYELSVSEKAKAKEDWGGLCLEPFVISQQEGQNDLVFDVMETEESLIGIFRYNTDLFGEARISRMAEHFQTLLEAIATDREQRISLLPMLTETESKRLLWEWNQTQVDYVGDKCIHQLFEKRVEISPEAVAVVFEGEQLTYQELNIRANQLAHYLQGLGIRPELPVGICVDRSLEMVIGLLGVLKAGGAYVALDPAYPQERLSFMVSDAQVSVLLTQEKLVEDLPNLKANIVLLDKDWEVIAQEKEINLNCSVTPDNLAYVVYTSGSTGKSKGVAIAHGSLVNAYYGWENAYQLESLNSHLQMASFSFDVFSGDLIRALGSGAKLVLCPREYLLQPEKLYQLMLQEGVDSAEFVPVVLRNLIQYLEKTQQNLQFMKLLVVGSDSFYLREYQKFQRYCGANTRLINSYGVSEATVDSTYFELGNGEVEVDSDRLTPIGRPFANVQTYILDRELQPVPVGIVGELHIGGMGLARGYVNLPELSAEKFVMWEELEFKSQKSKVKSKKLEGKGKRLYKTGDLARYLPDGNEELEFKSQKSKVKSKKLEGKGKKLYKTGDFARYLPDGNIEFIGRIDNQVKIRGFRIEVGEVEAVLSTHPQVREVVVIVREEEVDNRYLAAYIVAVDNSLKQSDLRNFLKQKLPEYMIPSAWVMLETLPLSPNGKIDRRALPIPDRNQNRQIEFVAPRNSREEAIAKIMATVLKLEKVGIHDNFFELGGHSLLATQVISQLQQTFNVSFPLRSLLEFPTVAGIGETLSELTPEYLEPLPQISPAPQERYQPFPLTDIQQAYWLGRSGGFDLGNVAAHGYLEIDSNNLDLERLSLAWQKLISRHDMLRAVFLPDGRQQILEQVPPYQIKVLDLQGKPPEVISAELEAVRDRMSHEVLPTDKWPLFRIRATRLDQQKTRLHLSFDALIADALSMFVIGREWSQIYEFKSQKSKVKSNEFKSQNSKFKSDEEFRSQELGVKSDDVENLLPPLEEVKIQKSKFKSDDIENLLPPLEISFRDYVFTELAIRETSYYQRSQEYWFNRLDNLPPGPELPLAKNPTSITQPEFKRRSAKLSSVQWQKLKERGNQVNLTPSGILLSAFAEILSLWSKSPKFTINLTLFQRFALHPQVNELVGDFTSLTLLEVDNSLPNSFTTRAQNLQQQLWQDVEHGYISGLQVQRELSRRRESYQFMPVVFTSTLGLDSLAQNSSMLGDLGELVYSISQTPQVWLDHQIREQNGTLEFNWDAVEDLFPEGLLDDMFAAYCNLLEQLATSDLAWLEIERSLLPEAQVQLREKINNHKIVEVGDRKLQDLFIEQVKLQGESLAVITPEYKFTYLELYQRASQLANRLLESGAKVNNLVGVVMEKGWEQVVAVLGILMSGAAYLPIDPGLPQERQWYLLEQGKVKSIVTQSHLKSRLSWPSNIECFCVELEEELEKSQEQTRRRTEGETRRHRYGGSVKNRRGDAEKGRHGDTDMVGASRTDADAPVEKDHAPRPCLPASPRHLVELTWESVQTAEDLAYVIYTSGSTGKPKGVAINHRGAVNTILDINQRFAVSASDRVLALSALNFDLSVYDIFGILAAGGTIVIPNHELLKDPAHWLDLIVTTKVTLWNSVPALMQMLVEYLSTQPTTTLPSLRLALLSGDWLPLNLPEKIQSLSTSPFPSWEGLGVGSHTSQVQVVSLGGATEASIWSIYYPIEKIDSDWKSIPYGKPLSNQQFYVFNQLMEATPVWVTGELYIGGEGLALGYWEDTEKTEASFITHPVTKERLYKTGDLGRYLPDGNIEFLGREDFQVKINGHRIELGEIEAALQQHPSIKEAVVSAVGEEQQKKQLVGYVVFDQELLSAQNAAEAYQPSQQEGVLTDPIERMEFKLKQPGVEQLESSVTSVELPATELDDNLMQRYLERQSYRQFLSEALSLKQLSEFLSCLRQMELEGYPLPKYRYPSAGNLYPVQTYLFIKPNRVAGLEGGLYYYHPAKHRLILINSTNEIEGKIYGGNKPIFAQSAFSIFLIGKLEAIAPIYGELAKDFCLLEAGHIGQLLMSSAPKQEIGLCPIGYLEFAELQDLLKLGSSQVLLYSFVGGKIDLAQTKEWLKTSVVGSQNQNSQSIFVQMREYLQQKLPKYMMPSEYIVLDGLPLTANGKVDRKMLPAPNLAGNLGEVLMPPKSEMEQTLVGIVQKLLQTEAVGVENNFFQLGMDSLKLVQLRNELQTELGVKISMKQLLTEATNIAELAVVVEEQLTLEKIKSSDLSTEDSEEREIIEL
ncbi:amino acid adenylation domain-containing protein [Dapis sp. BLCC M126]|uniref:amino acid adenylation domain-containing protein n=1 Tax=Dapis sp. BLCC M126 TaxID=3400189 RepID=UPI003CF5CBDA